MAMPPEGGRSKFLFIFLALISVTLLTLDSRGFGPIQSLKEGVGTITSPVRGAADWAFSPVGDAWEAVSDYDDLKSENEALRTELEESRGGQIVNENALTELEELKDLLDVQGLSLIHI